VRQKRSSVGLKTAVGHVDIHNLVTGGDELLEFGEARMEAIEGRFGILGKLAGEIRVSLEDVDVDTV
jgi:hypothetical protein